MYLPVNEEEMSIKQLKFNCLPNTISCRLYPESCVCFFFKIASSSFAILGYKFQVLDIQFHVII